MEPQADLKPFKRSLFRKRPRLGKDSTSQVSKDLAIIIPIGSGDLSWKNLYDDLLFFPKEIEILFAATRPMPDLVLPENMQWVTCPQGRAKQMNFATQFTDRKYYWFLHSDSRVSLRSFFKLIQSIQDSPNSVHYFDLAFQKDGPALMGINAIGVWIRSRLLDLPFGDQGLCIPKEHFKTHQGFDENVAFGEDHDFIWKMKNHNISIKSTRGIIRTSARKYQKYGWLKTTTTHLYLTIKQAIECKK